MVKKFSKIILLLAIFSQTVSAGTFWVDTNADNDPNTCVEDEAVNDNDCTFRDAISQLTTSDTIRFIDNENQTITFDGSSAVYSLATDGITIDAVTGTGHTIDINGANEDENAFQISGDDITIKGLYLYNFKGVGANEAINVQNTADRTTIDQNVIGLTPDGTVAANYRGIYVKGSDTVISNNTISGNTDYGISTDGGGGSNFKDLTITGNKIGTDTGGTLDKGNGGDGIVIAGGVNGTININGGNGGVEGLIIGGDTAAEANIISGNDGDGIQLGNAGPTINGTLKIQGNKIGVATNGTSALGNTGSGIVTGGALNGASSSLLIGTDGDATNDTSEANIVNNNGSKGISIATAIKDLTIAGNTIKSNTGDGISVNSTTVSGTITIGGDDAANAERNIIGSNTDDGIDVDDAGSTPADITIRNNYIGVDSNGTTAIGNTASGIEISDGGVLIIKDNVVSNNLDATDGISIRDVTTVEVYGNKIGTKADGITAAGNTGKGIYINGSTITSVIIGGATAALSNVIADNGNDAGIMISTLAANNTPVSIKGNYFGVGSDGKTTTGLGNGDTALALAQGSITIGGDNSLGAAGTGTLGEGNVISNNVEAAIYVYDSSPTAGVSALNIYGNIIGLVKSADGSSYNTAAGNGTGGAGVTNGIRIDSSIITSLNIGAVGSSEASSKRNVVSANYNDGIDLQNLADSATITLKNNYIGTDWLGSADRGNAGFGLYILDGATVNIGGSGANEGNVISGNSSGGIRFGSTVGNVNLYGNTVGLSADKTADLGNDQEGISFNSVTTAGSTINIGGVSSSERNYISGNGGNGIDVRSASNVTTMNILNNIIGLNGSGNAAIANSAGGISLDNTNATVAIGNGTTNGRNVIGGNGSSGIDIKAGNVSVKGNYIGVGSNGTTVIQDTNNSISATSTGGSITSLTIGGSGDNANKISNTGFVGVVFNGVTSANESTIDTDNTWTTMSNLSYNFWVRTDVPGAFGPQQCYDGVDNDGDHDVDYPNDPGCGSVTDASENSDDRGGVVIRGGSSNNSLAADDEGGDEADEEDDEVDENEEEEMTDEVTDGAESPEDDIEEEISDVASPQPSITPEEAKKELTDAASVVVDFVLSPEISNDEQTEDQQLIEMTLQNILDGTSSDDEIKDAEQIAAKIIKASLADAIKDVGAGGEFTIIRQGKIRKIDKKTKIEFSFDTKDAEERQAEAYEKGENKLIIGPSTIIGGGVSALLQIQEGGALDDPLASEKVFFRGLRGLNDEVSSKDDLIPDIPEITNLDGKDVPKKFLAWAAGTKPGEELKLSLIDKNYSTNETDYWKIYEGPKFVVGDDYKALMLIDIDELGIKLEQTKEFDILVQNEKEEGKSVMVKINPELDFAIESLNLDATLSGYSVSGTIIFISWKSLVLNSVVVADASQGYFEVEVPDNLEEGEHTVLVYAYNPSTNWISNIATLIFNR